MLFFACTIYLIRAEKKPKIIMNVATKKYVTAVGSDLLLTEERKSATPFCTKNGEGFNDELIQVCDDMELKNASEKPESRNSKSMDDKYDALNSKNKLNKPDLPPKSIMSMDRRSNLVGSGSLLDDDLDFFSDNKNKNVKKDTEKIEDGGISATSALGEPKKTHVKNEHSGLTITVQTPLMGSRKLTGSTVHLEPERPTRAQAFQIIELDDGSVRIINDNLCLSVKEFGGSVGKLDDKIIASACNKEDKNNKFKFIEESDPKNTPDSPRILDETKLAALKEVARVSPKLREKIGMDYLEMMS